MYKKIVYITLSFIILSFSCFSQEIKEYYYDDFQSVSDNISEYNNSLEVNNTKKKLSLLDKDRFHFRLTTGTSFTNFGNNSLYSVYTMPEINYRITDKFSISAGMIQNFSYFPNFSQNKENPIPMSSKMYNTTVFVKGEYQPLEKLILQGTVFYSPSSFNNSDSFSFTNFGMEYKITEKFSIGADVSIIKGNSQYSPFFYNQNINHTRNFGLSSPFNSSVF
ncbi:MAG: hypothetical protein LBV69_03200 [Bacteroidales bacterium]|jgi:hypothetical protein|nr:hypothetical protein [Bacteroidales bacterium]